MGNMSILITRGGCSTGRRDTSTYFSIVCTKYILGKGVCQGRILCPDSFIFYAVYNMRNAGLEEAHAGLKIAGRNISNLRYADDTTLMAENDEELKSLLMKVKKRVKKLA